MDTPIVISIVVYRIATVACGLAFAFLGFRLFCLGISERAGELQARFGNKGLVLRQVAPGIYFALFGTIIVGASVYRGVDISTLQSVSGATASTDEQNPKHTKNQRPDTDNYDAVGELLGIDPQLDLDNMPTRLLAIVHKLQADGEESLDNQEKELLKIWVGKLKARVTAAEDGTES